MVPLVLTMTLTSLYPETASMPFRGGARKKITQKRKPQYGFTLIECMLATALSVLAVVMLNQIVDQKRVFEMRLQAHWQQLAIETEAWRALRLEYSELLPIHAANEICMAPAS